MHIRRRVLLPTLAIVLAMLGQVCLSSGGQAATPSGSSPATYVGKYLGSTVTANDKQGGIGTARLVARVIAAAKHPLHATGTPVVIGQRVTVGGNYPFGDSVSAVTAMEDYYNNVLGGIGANYAKGIPGRPIKVIACTSDLSAAGAQTCGNQLLADKPLLILDTLNLTQTLEYSMYTEAGVPVVEATGLFPSKMSLPTIPVVDGGCLTSGAVPIVAALQKYHRVAFVTAGDLSISQLCLQAYQDIPKQFPHSTFKSFLYTTTSPDQLSLAEQVMAYHPDAIIEQTSGSNCLQFWSAWQQLGFKGKVYDPSSCQSASLFKSAGQQIDGHIFSFNIDNPAASSAFYKQYPLAKVEQSIFNKAFKTYEPSANISITARANSALFMWTAGVLDQMAIKGTPVTKANFLTAVHTANYHEPLAMPGPNCQLKVTGMTSLCNFTNGLWQVTSVAPDGSATWKLIAPSVDVSSEFQKVNSQTGTTTTSSTP